MYFFHNFQKIPRSLRDRLIILFVTGLMFWSSMASLLPTLPLYVQSLGGTPAQVGWVMGAFAVGLLLCRSQVGRLADRKGRQVVMQIGLVVAIAIPLCYATLPAIPAMMVLRAIHGISIAAFATGYTALVADLAPVEQRGEIIGYMSLVNPLGLAFGPAIGGWVQEAWGYQPLFLIAGFLSLVGLLCTQGLKQSHVDGSKLTSTPIQSTSKTSFWQTLTSPRVRIPALILLLIGLVFGTLSSFLPLLIKENHVPLNVGLFYMAAAIAGFIIRFPIGQLSDRYGRGLFISIGLGIYALSMGLISVSNLPPMFLLAGIFEGLGSGIVIPSIVALLADRTMPTERGFIFSLAWAGFDVGIAMAGPLVGASIMTIGLANAFKISTVLGILALIIFSTLSNQTPYLSWQFATGKAKDQYSVQTL